MKHSHLSGLLLACVLGPLVLGTACGGGGNCDRDTAQAFEVTTNADVESLLGCTNLSGRIVIDGTLGNIDMETFEFSNLETIEQGISIQHVNDVLTIAFPKLKRLATDGRFGDMISIGQNGSLRTVSAPLLESSGLNADNVTGGLEIYDNPALEQVNFPALQRTGQLEFTRNGLLAEVSLPNLETLRGGDPYAFTVRESGVTRISLPQLAEVPRDLSIEDNLFLTSFSAPKAPFDDAKFSSNPELSDVDLSGLTVSAVRLEGNKLNNLNLAGLTEATSLHVSGNSDLKTLSAPALTTISDANPDITSNPVLEHIDFPKLGNITGVIRITDNPSLPDCEAEQLVELAGGGEANRNMGDGCSG